ncbi:MAG: hypothetical protein E7413_05145 [Ruminococcaceae bacterium]|nr:hypothetical protein [Oscillospiraceae bacterium]
MKRVLALLCAFCLLFVLSGCVGKCDNCGKSGAVTKVSFEGEEANLCKDCKVEYDQLMDQLSSLQGQLQDLENLE